MHVQEAPLGRQLLKNLKRSKMITTFFLEKRDDHFFHTLRD